MSVSGWMFLQVPTHPGSARQRAVMEIWHLQLTQTDVWQRDTCITRVQTETTPVPHHSNIAVPDAKSKVAVKQLLTQGKKYCRSCITEYLWTMNISTLDSTHICTFTLTKFSWFLTIQYNTIRDAILTCARKSTWVSLIYCTETTKNCKTEKLKSKNRYARSNSKSLGNRVVSPEEEKERLQWEGFAEKGFKSGMKQRVGDEKVYLLGATLLTLKLTSSRPLQMSSLIGGSVVLSARDSMTARSEFYSKHTHTHV